MLTCKHTVLGCFGRVLVDGPDEGIRACVVSGHCPLKLLSSEWYAAESLVFGVPHGMLLNIITHPL